jgi:hypothetical protein
MKSSGRHVREVRSAGAARFIAPRPIGGQPHQQIIQQYLRTMLLREPREAIEALNRNRGAAH